MDALLYECPPLVSFRTGFAQRQHSRVAPRKGLLFGFTLGSLSVLACRKDVFFARDAVAITPELRAVGADLEI
jgi:hypothetical protein